MKWKVTTNVYNDMSVDWEGPVEVSDTEESSQDSFPHYDYYIDIFDTKEEADEFCLGFEEA